VLKAITEHVFHEPQGQEPWQKLPELPAGSEILATHIPVESLPHNRIDTAWPSKNDYLETHYRLLRHEGTEALRLAVNKYKSNITIDDDEDLCIYTKVRSFSRTL
jgi:helicase required for RNAi-mediated heterochromatin assembly 1